MYASWHGFSELPFFVGGNVSLKVPRDAKKLRLWVETEGEEGSTVRAVDVRAYVTKIEDYHLRANSALRLDRDRNGLVNLGSNLPTVIYRGKRDMGGFITIGKERFRVYQSAGAFGYIVKGRRTAN